MAYKYTTATDTDTTATDTDTTATDTDTTATDTDTTATDTDTTATDTDTTATDTDTTATDTDTTATDTDTDLLQKILDFSKDEKIMNENKVPILIKNINTLKEVIKIIFKIIFKFDANINDISKENLENILKYIKNIDNDKLETIFDANINDIPKENLENILKYIKNIDNDKLKAIFAANINDISKENLENILIYIKNIDKDKLPALINETKENFKEIIECIGDNPEIKSIIQIISDENLDNVKKFINNLKEINKNILKEIVKNISIEKGKYIETPIDILASEILIKKIVENIIIKKDKETDKKNHEKIDEKLYKEIDEKLNKEIDEKLNKEIDKKLNKEIDVLREKNDNTILMESKLNLIFKIKELKDDNIKIINDIFKMNSKKVAEILTKIPKDNADNAVLCKEIYNDNYDISCTDDIDPICNQYFDRID